MDDTVIIKCPGCSIGSIDIRNSETDIPHFGKVIISTIQCPECGYRSSDVVPLTSLPPRRYIASIDSEIDLSIRVIRSSTSTVLIPEIGLRIDPGTVNEGYITNVEGVFNRVLSILSHILRDLSKQPDQFVDTAERIERTNVLIEKLTRIMTGSFDKNEVLTIILEDPNGNSALVSDDEDDILTEDLTDEEIAKLMGDLLTGTTP